LRGFTTSNRIWRDGRRLGRSRHEQQMCHCVALADKRRPAHDADKVMSLQSACVCFMHCSDVRVIATLTVGARRHQPGLHLHLTLFCNQMGILRNVSMIEKKAAPCRKEDAVDSLRDAGRNDPAEEEACAGLSRHLVPDGNAEARLPASVVPGL